LEIHIVLVEPKYDGNIGSTARAMKNFGFENLVLINPCEIGLECQKMAMHAEDIVKSAMTFSDLNEFLKNIQVVVGTTGILNLNEKAHIRNPISPKELSEKLSSKNESTAILLGREDFGLTNNELALCDLVVSIPTSKNYPVMNISHAAAVIMYELSLCEFKVSKARGMTKQEKEKFFEIFDKLLLTIDYPDYKYENTKIILMGILNKAREYAEDSRKRKRGKKERVKEE
jgi:TrmH family RNA methyltransferase